MTRRAFNHRRGFTLIESMAAVVVLGVLGSMASMLILDTVGRCMDATTRAQLHAELAVAIDRATREIRKIPLESSSPVAPDITAVTSTSLQWNDSGGLACELSQSGSTLKLKMAGGTLATLLTDVTSFSIAAYNQDNASLGLPLDDAGSDTVRRIKVTVTITRNGISETLRTLALIRATMDGAQ